MTFSPTPPTVPGAWRARFWAKVSKTDDCWNWIGAIGETGYGNFGIGYRTYRAHRLSYEMHYGPIPSGMLVCHKCDNRKCVRPDHLFIGTHKDNMTDCSEKGRLPKTCEPKKFCKRGHPLSEARVTIDSNGYVNRQCMVCKAMTEKLWKQSHARKVVEGEGE
jgi:hypothetical protein